MCCVSDIIVYVLLFLFIRILVFFFFKQKTAYEMRISDWSSDVCSSDLISGCGNFLASSKQQEIVMTAKYPSIRRRLPASLFTLSLILAIAADPAAASETADDTAAADDAAAQEIGRASCRERVCQYV